MKKKVSSHYITIEGLTHCQLAHQSVCVCVCVCVCVWKIEYTQVHTGVGEIVSAVPTIDSKRNAQI